MRQRWIDAIAMLLLALAIVRLPTVKCDVRVPVNIDMKTVYATTSDGFLSVTIDASEIGHNFSGLDFRSKKLTNLGRALSPAVFRFGGTAEDYITYDIKMGMDNVMAPNYTKTGGRQPRTQREGAGMNIGMDRGYGDSPVTMTTEQWDYLNEYVNAIGMKLVFGLNAQKRSEDGSWDITNAKRLIEYTKEKGYDVSWELGNEPDSYPEHSGFANVSGEQMASDFHVLADYLKSNDPMKTLAGPDVATLSRYDLFQSFLDHVKDGKGPNVITWHQYYGNGKTFQLHDFYSSRVLDKLLHELGTVESMLKHADMTSAEVWLGETSSCYDGGAPGISDTFTAGFMWLDKLGLTALYNYTHICRQTLYGGSYSLLDAHTKDPLPDYFASLAYKQLMGKQVLSVEGQLSEGRTTRVYAHCTKLLPGSMYKPGAVTLMAMNLDNATSAQLRLPANFDHTVVAQYVFAPPPGSNVQSKVVCLNKNPLSLINGEIVPELRPQLAVIPTDGTIQVPPLTYAFFVLPTANATACM